MAFENYFGPQPMYGAPMQAQMPQFRQMQYPQYSQPQPVPQSPQMQQPQQNAGSGITWVQGESGAKSFFVGAGQTVMLMNSEGDSFFIKSASEDGVPLPLRTFDYKERISSPKPVSQMPADYVTREEFQALEGRINALIDNQKPAKKPIKEEMEDA